MAVGPVSRLPIAPLPAQRSLVPVSDPRAQPPVPPVIPTDKADRKPARRIRKVSDQESDSATARSSAGPAETTAKTGEANDFQREVDAAPSSQTGGRGWSAPGTAPFVTQVLAQEVLTAGLYIEPWRQAIDAYERAANAAGPRLRYQMP
jgi:hypothetical protein